MNPLLAPTAPGEAPSAEVLRLRDHVDKLNFALNFVRLPLTIDPAISNLDTPRLLAAFAEKFDLLTEIHERLQHISQMLEHPPATFDSLQPWTYPESPAPAIPPPPLSHE